MALSILRIWKLSPNEIIKNNGKRKTETIFTLKFLILVITLLIQRKKCPYAELFWPTFSCIWSEYGETLRTLFTQWILHIKLKFTSKFICKNRNITRLWMTYYEIGISFVQKQIVNPSILKRETKIIFIPTECFFYTPDEDLYWSIEGIAKWI